MSVTETKTGLMISGHRLIIIGYLGRGLGVG
jgi:hypothetical protein